MPGARAIRAADPGSAAQRLYERIGSFLVDQRLEPDPANFAFAYHLLSDANGPLARAVAALTDGGVRLTQRDIDSLDCGLKPNHKGAAEKADGLVAQTQLQVEGFTDMMRAMQAETQGFGRELAQSAEALRRSRDTLGDERRMVDEVGRLTLAMLDRVHAAEARLESATREASELREKLEEARENARRDPLTDLPNRRAFEEAYAQQARAGVRICVAVCDIDHFKSVNDRFGHAIGDRVLKAIAAALAESCDDHLVARYGGEEFAILFTGIELADAVAKLDTARARVATRNYRVRDGDFPLGEITFSAGLTPADDEMLATVFQRADRLMYAAKLDGRNCLRVG